MAVKQNNTETNVGVTTPANDANTNVGVPQSGTNTVDNNGGVGNTVSGNVGVAASGVIAKSQKMSNNNKNHKHHHETIVACGGLVGSGINDEQLTINKHQQQHLINNVDMNDNTDTVEDLSDILKLIAHVRKNSMPDDDWFRIYQFLLEKLAHVQNSKIFQDDIDKIAEFFDNRQYYIFYLSIVYHIVTKADPAKPPSYALAIIFQLFEADQIETAVQSLLDMKYTEQMLKQAVYILCDWLRHCKFCHTLNKWILAILTNLQKRRKYALFDEICLQNIDKLFFVLIIPQSRTKMKPVPFHMLSTTQDFRVFHKILPKLPNVIMALKQQSNSQKDYANDAKKVLHELNCLIARLFFRFHGYDELYKPYIIAIRKECPTFNYNISSQLDDDDNYIHSDDYIDLNSRNVKVGLVNLGNTCYMNSVLQALTMTKEFARELLLSQCPSPLLTKMRQQIALMLYSQRYELKPSHVLNATGFSPGLQQDSSEFLGYLLETLHEQEAVLHKMYSKNANTNCYENDVEPIAKSAKQEAQIAAKLCGNKNITSHSTNGFITSETTQSTQNQTILTVRRNSLSTNGVVSTVQKIFTGKLATTYKCLTCGWKSRNVDSFRDMQLSFPEVKNECASNYSVQDLIDYYCSPEKLDGDNQYFCERCKKLSDAERYINVISAPKNLILILKHFKYDQKYHTRAKLMHKVFHDEKITVKVCAVETLDEVTTVHYDLYAGVVHSGFSMDSGHYYTYASDSTNKWFKFNDHIVTRSNSEELHNLTPPNTPYILFYQMCSQSGPEDGNPTNLACGLTAGENYGEVKVETPMPLTLDELPGELREYVNYDNGIFAEELRMRRFTASNENQLQNGMKVNSEGGSSGDSGARGYNNYDDDDNDPPPPAGGCGGNALNINVNRFVY